MSSATNAAQIRLDRVTPSNCRVVLDNPPLNLMGPEFVLQIREIVTELENDDRVKVVVFESAVDGCFLNHSDFLANVEDLTSIPQGPTGLEAWPDVLVRLTRAAFVSIALIRGRATGNGSELALACDMSFARRARARQGQWPRPRLRQKLRQPREGALLAVGSGRRPCRWWRAYGAAAARHGT